MPGLVKIGKTNQEKPETRVAQLYSTGVPVPFTIAYACEVDDDSKVESALHEAFDPQRINARREFFEIEPAQAIAILRLLDRDVTEEVAADTEGLDARDIEAAERLLRSRRPNLNLQEMSIPIGATLLSTRNETAVEVTGPKKVRYEEEEMSLSAATKLMMKVEYALAPAQYWTFEGKILKEIYEETYSAD